jgi:hypothetical protein
MRDLGPWLGVVGLGAFHGLNPAMGWLFAVALGLHRGSRRSVLLALAPIALGHATAVALVAPTCVALGRVAAEATEITGIPIERVETTKDGCA